MRLILASLLMLWVAGCDGNETGADAGPGGGQDAAVTACGTLSCNSATTVCVSCECGGPTSFSCEPIPTGCDADRSCACVADTLCAPTAGNPIATCTDTGDNAIDCDRGLD